LKREEKKTRASESTKQPPSPLNQAPIAALAATTAALNAYQSYFTPTEQFFEPVN
jgi:hypothetical protein